MKIVVGLGNPGKKYERNRHNIGFDTVEYIAKNNNFSPWRKKFQAKVSEGTINSHKILLVKPETFMNNSGFSIKEILLFFKLKPDNFIIIHDDLDLSIGKIKVKVGGGNAGHNGLESIDQQIGKKYLRLRIGIDRPQKKYQVSKYVLSNFSEEDRFKIDTTIKFISKDLESLISGEINTFTASLNKNLDIASNSSISSDTKSNKFNNLSVKKLIRKMIQ